ncbi:hypothetical protein [Bacillus xiapuensis]|uniref:hypothetical protein n=1 Tax=Bacillus xiapuensis TaxID=2014075 RepID=UPI0012FE60EF|nr:hypothetical protein [Bacillus xiapuensis]
MTFDDLKKVWMQYSSASAEQQQKHMVPARKQPHNNYVQKSSQQKPKGCCGQRSH